MRKQVLTAALSLIYLYIKKNMRTNKNRKWWVRPLYRSRDQDGFYAKNFRFIKKEDPEQFYIRTRMREKDFDYLVNLLQKDLIKTSIRKAIVPECRTALTFIYLAHGVPLHYLAWTFKMGKSTVREIILEVCNVMWNNLSCIYMPQCQKQDWEFIANEFNNKWQLPNCIGSIDGKHIQIKCPPKSGSMYYNYKGYSSIVVLAVCDADYIFTMVDVGAVGSQSDGSILQQTIFGEALVNNKLDLTEPTKLPNSSLMFPYFLVGGNAFPLRTHLMRPFPNLNSLEVMDVDKVVFNYRISRGRHVIENAFGILTARWRVLLKMMEYYPKNAEKIVLACTFLHNFLKTNLKLYTGYIDLDDQQNGNWREEIKCTNVVGIQTTSSNNASRLAFAERDKLKSYFMNQGQTTFQNKYLYHH